MRGLIALPRLRRVRKGGDWISLFCTADVAAEERHTDFVASGRKQNFCLLPTVLADLRRRAVAAGFLMNVLVVSVLAGKIVSRGRYFHVRRLTAIAADALQNACLRTGRRV